MRVSSTHSRALSWSKSEPTNFVSSEASGLRPVTFQRLPSAFG
jgi:hypothetical protein